MQKIKETLSLIRSFTPHIAILLAALLVGWGMGKIKIDRDVEAADLNDMWRLPSWKPYTVPNLNEVLRSDLWGGNDDSNRSFSSTEIDENKTSSESEEWKLVGTLQDGGTSFALILNSGNAKIEYVALGDLTPNGEEVIDIGEGTLVLLRGEETLVMKLFEEGE